MRIFLSWSGDRSKAIADVLRAWIPDVIQTVEPWASQADIQPGVRWAEVLARALQQTRFGIICLTPENLAAPWILFEAGALSKALKNTRVCPYLCDLAPHTLAGPLSQFQAVESNKEGTLRLLVAINEAMGETALEPRRLTRSFDKYWPDLESRLRAVMAGAPASPARSVDETLGEVLRLVRSIDARLAAQQKG
jgi:hypothetical protein